MKYKPIFGDQSNFDKADADAVCAYYPGDGFSLLSFISEDKLKKLTRPTFLLINIVAMRRIIKEPKRWTVEDQKAGRLPEVGSDVLCSNGKTIYTIEAVNKNENQLCVRDGDDGDLAITYTQYVTPIETQEERAQREEDEFVSLVESKYNHMPNEISFRAGIRAAYRKLKGGE